MNFVNIGLICVAINFFVNLVGWYLKKPIPLGNVIFSFEVALFAFLYIYSEYDL